MHENFVIHPNYSHLAAKLTDVLHNFSKKGEYVTKGERNVIKKVQIEETFFNIKKFKTPNAFQSLVYQFLRKSKAKRSFEYASKLIDFGIKTPFPVAYLEVFSGGLKESFYVSEHVNYDFDFRELIHNPKFENRNEILRQFTQFTFKLHENGVNFLDHSPGNTLIVDRGNDTYEFYLIDLNRMRFEPMDFNARMHNFRRLWLSKTMMKVMAQEYAELYNKSVDGTYALMLHYSREFQKKVNSKKLRRRR
ncbi:Mn2+-dependent serine/threonine protein kinase [Aequorivita sublithincola DSM 14238]|uniref:Mn2+-dependent serine/threonine protein kinase n=1 Tax=Aequorivita sublithincola (strain DSM 14238 / LMG 21431 / ACAM 643 / 9-3) TaxID=746697 RepID=I3YXM2_AEQSU|nr:lipopolysaccharide kinase InaA family protein [Aequorivita sublithincola]AFL81740.1 Mn2+-dependent serine/threonine protein kinase [Aequorivita sublithincola DSM 14238]